MTEPAASTPYASIAVAAQAHSTGLIGDAWFIAAAVALPIVKQNPMPDRWFDDWPQVDGPLSDLQDALRRRLITAELYDAALIAMAGVGHEA